MFLLRLFFPVRRHFSALGAFGLFAFDTGNFECSLGISLLLDLLDLVPILIYEFSEAKNVVERLDRDLGRV